MNTHSQPNQTPALESIPAYYFDKNKLDQWAEEYAETFQSASPFPHIYIDDFVEPWVVDKLLEEFIEPTHDLKVYETHNQSRNKKMSTELEYELGPFTRHFFYCLNSSVFVRFLEKLSGVNGLLPDPHLFGGGQHRTEKGGFLKMHVDNNWDTKLLCYRSMNVILYLNKDWKQEYGGNLELWNQDLSKCEASISPVAGRLAIFYNSEISYHGHPDPLNCPEGVARKSLATYYYTSERPAHEVVGLPHTTRYRPRPGETFTRRKMGVRVLGRFVPPVFSDVYKYLKRRNQLKPGEND